jgi:hypothetical protein
LKYDKTMKQRVARFPSNIMTHPAMTNISCVMAVKSIVFFLAALLFFASGAWARPITEDDARSAAENWLSREAKPMGSLIGHEVKKVETFTDETGGPAYYVIYLRPSGLIFLPADDQVEPIIGFVSDATSYDPSPKNPLGALVSRDIPGRVAYAREKEAVLQSGGTPAADSRMAKAQKKWARLAGAAGSVDGAGPVPSGGSDTYSISDVRVAPFVQSLWSQACADGSNPPCTSWCADGGNPPCKTYSSSPPSNPDVFNYYSPPNQPGDPNNYVCGCVATAMAQVMRYFKYPTAGIGVKHGQYSINGGGSDDGVTLGGDGKGGPYNWENMPLNAWTSSPITADQAQEIGRLTWDAGLAVGMNYTGSSGSGAVTTWDVAASLRNWFQYANAVDGWNDGNNIPEFNLLQMVNPNLHAKLPVIFGIMLDDGSEGHEIVCDGYGYNGNTIYHHLNMGWGGSDNAWYNLPTIDPVINEYQFNAILMCTYNIFTSFVGGEIIAGRVIDGMANPLGGVEVKLNNLVDPFDNKLQTTTDANGIYAFTVFPASSFLLTAAKDGYTFPPPYPVSSGTSVSGTTTTGNQWISDTMAVLSAPTAPTGVKAEAGDSRATVSFTAPASYGGVHLAKYTVYQSPGTAVTTGTTSPIIVKGLKNGTAYTFQVTATNAAGKTSPKSSPAKATPLAATTTSVSSSKNPSNLGQSVTFKATVTSPDGTPAGGAVQFIVDGQNFGTAVPLSGGSATIQESRLSAGNHSVKANYSEAKLFAPSSGSLLNGQTIKKASSTTTVISNPEPSTYDQSVTFTAMVSPSTATGFVTFKDGTTTLGTGTLSGGKATCATSTLPVGTRSITAVYLGDTDYAGSTSKVLTQTVNKASTTTTVISSAESSTYGQSVTFMAVVSPPTGIGTVPASGTVTFKDGKTKLGIGTLSGGNATYTTPALAAGVHSITAVYGGDTNYVKSTSSVLTQTVKKVPTTTTVISSAESSTYGQSVTFTAMVSSPGEIETVTGTVTFKDGKTELGTGTLSGGKATCATSTLPVGTHIITAVYLGDTNYATSTSPGLIQAVNKVPTTTTVISSAESSTYGQSVTFTATVSPSTATGTVTFKDGATTLGTGALSGGKAIYTTSTLKVGPHSITAAYGGDTNDDPTSIFQVLIQIVNPATVTPSITASNKTYDGTTTASVTGSLSGVISGDAVSLKTPITANFASKNAGTGITVTATGLSLTGSSAANYALSSTTATTTGAITARAITVTAASNTKVYDGKTSAAATPTITSGSLASGDTANFIETYNTPNGGTGKTLTPSGAVNDGNGGNNYAVTFVSNTTGVIYQAGSTMGVTSSSNPSAYGQAVTFTVTVTGVPGGATPTGTVQFVADVTIPSATVNIGGPVSLSNGSAVSPAISNLAVGDHSIVANYIGDANYTSNAGTLSGGQTVKTTASTTSLTSSANPSTYGQSVTFTATVSPSTATGTVTFMDSTSTLGTGTLSGGKATYATSTLAAATHSITAVYGGDTNDATSTSSVFTQTVNKASSTTGISSSENPSNPGDSITFEAGVTGPGGYPTGTVQFVVDGSNFGSPVSLSISRFGELTFDSATSSATSSLSSGNHTVAAVYSGDNNYTGSSATLSGGQTVKTPTTLSLSSSENPSVVGNPVTFTAMLNIKNAAPTGTVQFQVNGTNLGTAVPVSNRLLIHIPPTYSNSATSEADSFPNPEGGNYTITATYSGDNTYMGSSGTMNESVNQPPPK